MRTSHFVLKVGFFGVRNPEHYNTSKKQKQKETNKKAASKKTETAIKNNSQTGLFTNNNGLAFFLAKGLINYIFSTPQQQTDREQRSAKRLQQRQNYYFNATIRQKSKNKQSNMMELGSASRQPIKIWLGRKQDLGAHHQDKVCDVRKPQGKKHLSSPPPPSALKIRWKK